MWSHCMADDPIYLDGFTHQLTDIDPVETEEWLDALQSVVDVDGRSRATYLMSRLLERSREESVTVPGSITTRM